MSFIINLLCYQSFMYDSTFLSITISAKTVRCAALGFHISRIVALNRIRTLLIPTLSE